MIFFNILIAFGFFPYLSSELKLNCVKTFSKFNNCIADGFDGFEKQLEIYCDQNTEFNNLIILPNTRLALKSDSNIILRDCSIDQIVLNNFRSLSPETKLTVDYDSVQLFLYNSDFVFASFDANNFIPNLFNLNGLRSIAFRNEIRYLKQETSPLVFKNSLLTCLEFLELTNSSSKRNYFQFNEEANNMTYLNSSINELRLFVYKLTLSSRIMNELVFEKLERLMVLNQLEYIEPDTFKPFKNLKQIYFGFYSLKPFFQRDTRRLAGLNYAYENYTNVSNTMVVSFAEKNFHTSQNVYYFPDNDFCLFKYFPHQRRVLFSFNICIQTCTFLWLVQNTDSLSKCADFSRLNCNFTKLLNKCEDMSEHKINSTSYYENDEYSEDNYYLEKKADFVLSVIVFPIICILGSALNLLNMLVLSNKNYKKLMQQRMYELMFANSFINFLVCLIYLFRLAIKCIDPINNYCAMSLITNKALRYIFLTLVNYIGNLLKTLSNLIQISISIDRIQLSTQTNFGWLRKHSKIKMKYLMLVFFAFSSVINFIKVFQYDYDLDYEFLRYPVIARNYFNTQFWYSYFNFAHIFLNNVCIVFIQVIIDLVLFNSVKQSWRKIQQQLNNKNEKVERNIIVMIITTGVCLFVLHTPDLIISIYMATTYLIELQLKGSTPTAIDTRGLVLFSFLFNIISDVIYFLGFSLNTLLYYAFNSVFRGSMRDLLP
jgi:hypothetical protein